MTLLSLQGISLRYRRGDLARWLLRSVWLDVAPGEVVSVLALRSQGKTTLLRLAAGMVAPDEGRVLLGRTDLGSLSDPAHARVLREQLGWAGRLGPGLGMQMLDYVALRLTLGGRSHRRAVRSLALAALERVGVEHCAERRWGELSDWERALVELAQALASAPRLLLIDDLLDGLGARETEEVSVLVRTLAEELGLGVLMTVSDPEAALCSHRVLSLAGGCLTVLSDVGAQEPGVVIDFPHGRPPGLRDARRG
jgi:ABC-type cobalamin/Fe3+-siderophores transport system ATPase subunit